MIQPGKIIIFGKKPEISLRIWLFRIGKKLIPLMQGFPNSGKEWKEVNSPQWSGESRKFYWGENFLPGKWNLRMSDFDDSNLFQS